MVLALGVPQERAKNPLKGDEGVEWEFYVGSLGLSRCKRWEGGREGWVDNSWAVKYTKVPMVCVLCCHFAVCEGFHST